MTVARGCAVILAGEVLGVDEEGEALVEREVRRAGVVSLVLPGLGHAEQVPFIQLFEGGLRQHVVLLHGSSPGPRTFPCVRGSAGVSSGSGRNGWRSMP